MSNSRGIEIDGAKSALNKMKLEVATELGIPDYDKIDKGNLPARVHGKVGGNMVRKMVQAYESNATAMENVSTPLADASLQQDKEVVQSLLH